MNMFVTMSDEDHSEQEFLSVLDIQLDELATRHQILQREYEELKAESRSWERLYNDMFRMMNMAGAK
jgi:uncharacterized small protein (DUF1192 family)